MRVAANKKKIYIILVNLITSIRIIGTFVMIPIYLIYGNQITCLCAIFFLFTDFLDGQLARRLQVSTFFGGLIDALSDKIFGIVSLLILSTTNPIYLIIIALELLVLITNFTSFQNGNNVKSSKIGKIKTFILSMAIIIGLFFINVEYIPYLVGIPTILIDLLSFYDYYKKSKNNKNKKPIKKNSVKKSKEEIMYMLFDTDFYQKHKDEDLRKLLYK